MPPLLFPPKMAVSEWKPLKVEGSTIEKSRKEPSELQVSHIAQDMTNRGSWP